MSNKNSDKKSGGGSLYQQAYHLLAANTGGAEGRRKAMRTIRASSSPAFVAACEKVKENNPHFFMDKSNPNYDRVRARAEANKNKRAASRIPRKSTVKVSSGSKTPKATAGSEKYGPTQYISVRNYADKNDELFLTREQYQIFDRLKRQAYLDGIFEGERRERARW